VGHHKDMDGLGTEYRKMTLLHLRCATYPPLTVSHEDTDCFQLVAVAAYDNDAVCINYISMTWPNGAAFGFLGDVGQKCGANW
jgi:hypothetical protein